MSNCPECGNTETRCKDSRPTIYKGQYVTRRRRYCPECRIRYSTYELTEEFLEKLDSPQVGKNKKIKDLLSQIYVTIEE